MARDAAFMPDTSDGIPPPPPADALPAVPASQLVNPEDQHPAITSSGMDSGLDNLTRQFQKRVGALAQKLPAAYAQKAAADKEEAASEAKQWENYRKDLADIRKNDMPQAVQTAAPPKPMTPDTMKQFGSLASMIGIFASAFTKKPIVNALNASADAMKAQQQGDEAAYERSYKEWKDQTDLALKKHDEEVERLSEIMELSKTDQASAIAELKAYAAVNGSDAAAVLSELGDWTEIGKYLSSMQGAGVKLKEAQAKIEEEQRKQSVYKDSLDANLKAGMPKAEAESHALAAASGKSETTPTTLTPDAIKLAAKSYLITHQLPYLGFGSAGGDRQAILNAAADMAKEEGLSPDDIFAGQASYKADQHSLMNLSKITDSAVAFEGTARNNMKIALSLMGQGGGTSVGPVVNRWVQAGRRETGDPEVKAFNTAITTAANEYAKVMSGATGSQGSTDAARAQANSLISQIDSPQAVTKVFDTMIREMNGRNQSYASQRGIIEKRLRTEGQTNQPIAPEGDTESLSGLPENIVSKLKHGVDTTFSNGQIWTLDENGEPMRLQ